MNSFFQSTGRPTARAGGGLKRIRAPRPTILRQGLALSQPWAGTGFCTTEFCNVPIPSIVISTESPG